MIDWRIPIRKYMKVNERSAAWTARHIPVDHTYLIQGLNSKAHFGADVIRRIETFLEMPSGSLHDPLHPSVHGNDASGVNEGAAVA